MRSRRVVVRVAPVARNQSAPPHEATVAAKHLLLPILP